MNEMLTPTAIDTLVAARSASSAGCYPILLCFVREFTAGTLLGIKHVDTLPFCDEASAAEWVRKINAKQACGKMEYRVIEHSTRPLAD